MSHQRCTTPKITSLSDVLPPESVYFYAFPAGWDSKYFNDCPPDLEELVAMRPAVCAGGQVGVVAFASTSGPEVWSLFQGLGVPLLPRDRLITLPTSLDHNVRGDQRNRLIKEALAAQLPEGRLLMAQPYLEEHLHSRYLFDPEIVMYFNDKQNIRDFVPAQYRTPEYARFPDGRHFREARPALIPLPCVVKVSSSGAGDGVRVCRSRAELERVQAEFQVSTETVLIQQYVPLVGDVDLKFAIPHDPKLPCQLIGFSSEVTGPNGAYMGSVVHPLERMPSVLRRAFDVLEVSVLPRLRQAGWFGVGGVDVLISNEGQFYFSDFNCRMTASMAQTLQHNTGAFGQRSALTFNGRFDGSLKEFATALSPLAQFGDQQQILNLIAIAYTDATAPLRLHGSVLFDPSDHLPDLLQHLKHLGIQSGVFDAPGLAQASNPDEISSGWSNHTE